MNRRRALLFGMAAAAIAARLPAAAPAAARPRRRGIRVDALCYADGEIGPASVGRALAGGLDSAVLDIAVYPREPAGAEAELRRWAERFADPAMRVRLVARASDFAAARSAGELGIVLACQDASILGSSGADYQERLSAFHALGLRVLQLSHNQRSPFGDGYQEPRDGGLSLAGRRLVEAMNRLGILVDLSHCSPHTLLDSVALSARPCAVTHSGCRALAPSARNKSDEEIRALGGRGGFFGIFNMSVWLTSGPRATVETLVRHIDHAAGLIGADRIGFGSDGALDSLDAEAEVAGVSAWQKAQAGGPGGEWIATHVRIPALNAPDRMDRLADALASRRYSDAQIDGILGGNFIRIFAQACG